MYEVLLSKIKYLSFSTFFLLVTACSNVEEKASEALRELGVQYEAATLWNFGSPRPGLVNEDDVDAALKAILEIRAELEAVVAKFQDTMTAKDILSEHGIYSDGLSIQKIDAQVKYLQSEKLLFKHRSKVLSEQENNSISRAFGFSFTEKTTRHAKKNQSICIMLGTIFRVYRMVSSVISS